jgi:hypothetical protein
MPILEVGSNSNEKRTQHLLDTVWLNVYVRATPASEVYSPVTFEYIGCFIFSPHGSFLLAAVGPGHSTGDS